MKTKIISALLLGGLSTDSMAALGYGKKVSDKISTGEISYFLQSKKGKDKKSNMVCEDGLFYNQHYLAVFDGATDKSGKKYNGKKGGRISRDIIEKVFTNLSPKAKKHEVVSAIQKEYQKFYNNHSKIDFKNNPMYRPTASLIWYSFARNELVAIGDTKARVDGKVYNDEEKVVDKLNSSFRVHVIKTLKLTKAQVKNFDLGRVYIMPLLKNQASYQNNSKAPKEFQYWVVDGFDIPKTSIKSWNFSKKPKRIELSSDGYVNLPKMPSIDAYEKELSKLLKNDALRIENPSTKGIKKGYQSFDDRAVLIFQSN